MSALKTAFRASPESLYPTYTGGPVTVTRDAALVITTLGEEQNELLVSEVASGRGVARIKGDGTPITAMALSYHTSPPTLLTAHQSLSVRYYPLPSESEYKATLLSQSLASAPLTKNGRPKLPFLTYTRQLTRNQTHQSPILTFSISPPIPSASSSSSSSSSAEIDTRGYTYDEAGNLVENSLFATGSADGVVKVWDTKGGFVTHVFKGHGGGVSALGWRFLHGANDLTSDGAPTTEYMNVNVRKNVTVPERGGRVMQLLTGSIDSRVRVFDLLDPSHRGGNGGKPQFVLEGHVSVVRGISVNSFASHEADQDDEVSMGEQGRWMVTAGRDRVVLLWDFGPRNPTTTDSTSKKTKRPATTASAPKVVQTTLANETLEVVGFVDPQTVNRMGGIVERGRLVAYTGGEKGVAKLWDVKRAQLITKLASPGSSQQERDGDDDDESDQGEEEQDEDDDDEDADDRGIKDILYCPSESTLVSVHHDQNILFTSLITQSLTRQIVGFNDEIIDTVYLSPGKQADTHIALATNSSLIRVYDTTRGMDARLVKGHHDVVLCLDVSADGKWMASGSKDSTVRIWAKQDDQAAGSVGEWRCVAIAQGHAESIGAIAFARRPSESSGPSGTAKFIFSASQDRTVKMWDLSPLNHQTLTASSTPLKLKSLTTMKIHEKDINSLDVSPNDGYLVSGSQDKSIKVFSIQYAQGKPTASGEEYSTMGASGSIKLLGTCQGHRRGVWDVKFSPTDRVIASCGGDKVARIWSLDDFTCQKTLEGHTNSVLRIAFMSRGQQLVSSGSDGLVKVWNLKEEECVRTLDGHIDKVWAMTISSDQSTILSGGADSVLNIWQDCTAEIAQEEIKKRESELALEQDYSSYLAMNDYKRAIQLALAMGQPRRLLGLFEKANASRPASRSDCHTKEQIEDFESITGLASVDRVLVILSPKDLVRLLKYVRDWNSRVHTCGTAQRILGAVLRGKKGEDLRESFEKARRTLGKPTAMDDDDDEQDDDQDATMTDSDSKPKKPTRAQEEIISLQAWLEGMVPYTERHLQRLDRALVDSFMLDYILGEMDGGMLDGIEDGGDEDGMEGLMDLMMDEIEQNSGDAMQVE